MEEGGLTVELDFNSARKKSILVEVEGMLHIWLAVFLHYAFLSCRVVALVHCSQEAVHTSACNQEEGGRLVRDRSNDIWWWWSLTQWVGHGYRYTNMISCMRPGDGVRCYWQVYLPKGWCEEDPIEASSFIVCDEGLGAELDA